MTALTLDWVIAYSNRYDAQYDEHYYQPYIVAGRQGDPEAIAALTRWKNLGSSGRPLNLSRRKQASLDRFLKRLTVYRDDGGEALLRKDFRWRAPVWSIFWCHVLYMRPIFDRYTYTAWQEIAHGRRLTRAEAIIRTPGHWQLYDAYRIWFDEQLKGISLMDNAIDDRKLDHALFEYGKQLLSNQQQ
jgi:hypothetical protein